MTLTTMQNNSEAYQLAQENAELKEHGGTCYGKQVFVMENKYVETGFQNRDCVCPTNNTCTWAYDGVCDDVKMFDNGVCAEGTDCEDCGTCNWYRCVTKAELPKPTNQVPKCESTYATLGMRTFYVCESTTGDVLDEGPTDRTPSPTSSPSEHERAWRQEFAGRGEREKAGVRP